jgi:hypothetical protein
VSRLPECSEDCRPEILQPKVLAGCSSAFVWQRLFALCAVQLANRVTRFGTFSSIGLLCIYFGHFLNIGVAAQIFGLLFITVKSYIFFDEKKIWPYFGRFCSQTRLVALLANKFFIKNVSTVCSNPLMKCSH